MTVDRITALEDALKLAANRLHRCCVDYDTGTHKFVEVGEWADEARAALAASRAAPDCQQPDLVTAAQVRTAWWCNPCRSVGMVHCSDPEHCGFMRTCGQEADEWKSWLDDLPLHEDFSTGIERLQDFITRIVAALDLTPAPAVDHEHPDDAAVDRFASAMKGKLARKRLQGRGGWDGPECDADTLSRMLREHVEKGDPLDVGNLAMMLHQRGERISAPAVEPRTAIGGDESVAVCPICDIAGCQHVRGEAPAVGPVAMTAQDAARALRNWWNSYCISDARVIVGVCEALRNHTEDQWQQFDAALRAIGGDA